MIEQQARAAAAAVTDEAGGGARDRADRRLRPRARQPHDAHLRTQRQRQDGHRNALLARTVALGARAFVLDRAGHYELLTAAREAGHATHGDGTALDLVRADGITQTVWDASASRLAHDLGWNRRCGSSGTRPARPLVAAIQFIGYDGSPGHGSPRSPRRQLRRAPARLLGFPVLRDERPLAAVRTGRRLRGGGSLLAALSRVRR